MKVNLNLLNSKMALYGDTNETLSKALDLMEQNSHKVKFK